MKNVSFLVYLLLYGVGMYVLGMKSGKKIQPQEHRQMSAGNLR